MLVEATVFYAARCRGFGTAITAPESHWKHPRRTAELPDAAQATRKRPVIIG